LQTAEEALAVFAHRRAEPSLTASQVHYLTHLARLRAAAAPLLSAPFLTLTSLVLEPVPLFNRAADGCRPYVEVWQGGERVLSTLVDYGRLAAFSCVAGDESATIALNNTAVCGDVHLVVYHARQQGAITKTTTGVRMCSVAFHTDSLPPGRPAHKWRLPQLDAVGGNENRFSEKFRLVLNCVRSEEASGQTVVWPRPEARQLLFNSEQDFEATLRLVPRSRSKFFLNNPGWGGTGTDAASSTPIASEGVGETQPVAPPRAARTNAATLIPAEPAPTMSVPSAVSFPCDDLLGLNSPPLTQSSERPTGSISPVEDLLVGLSPPAVHEGTTVEPPVAAGFDFLADLSQPAAPTTLPPTGSQGSSK